MPVVPSTAAPFPHVKARGTHPPQTRLLFENASGMESIGDYDFTVSQSACGATSSRSQDI